MNHRPNSPNNEPAHAMTQSAAPAGWYPTSHNRTLRWWDGRSWRHQVQISGRWEMSVQQLRLRAWLITFLVPALLLPISAVFLLRGAGPYYLVQGLLYIGLTGWVLMRTVP